MQYKKRFTFIQYYLNFLVHKTIAFENLKWRQIPDKEVSKRVLFMKDGNKYIHNILKKKCLCSV